MWAILEDSVAQYLKNCNKQSLRAHRIFQWEEVWIMSSDMGSSFISFENICNAIGLAPEYLRMGLRRKVREIQKTTKVWHRPMRDSVTHQKVL